MIKKIIILFLLCATALKATCQNSHLELIARPLTDSITLRWAPSDYGYWELGNKYGYVIVRYTLFRGDQLLENPEEKILLSNPLKPLPLERWEEVTKIDKAATVAAQAIYGKTFEIETGNESAGTDGTVPVAVYQRSEENEMRYGAALYVADISPVVAEASGLLFTDKSVKNDEEYLYRIFLALPDSLATVGDTAFVLSGVKYSVTLPAPEEFEVKFGDRQATISWNSYILADTYIAYEAQRSDNGKEYFNLSDNLSIPITSDVETRELSFMIDSIPDNNKKYFYRIRGISSFGERGPWSDPVTGQGVTSLKIAPEILSYEINIKGLTITWKYPEEMENSISGFRVYRSDTHNGEFDEIGIAKSSARIYTDNQYKPTNYYIVEAFNDVGSSASSFPILAQKEDNDPPTTPIGLVGIADTSLSVSLRWEENREADLLGYIVFRSVSGNDEFSRLTPSPINQAVFIDTLNKKDLNKEVFYKVAAIDQRYNVSELSAPAEIIKPDIIPPTRPLIRNVTVIPEGQRIVFDKSSDEDVSVYEIYRQIIGDTVWTKLDIDPADVNNGQSILTDRDAPSGKAVVYKITAIDNSGNRSDSPPSVAVKPEKTSKRTNIDKISGHIDRENGKVFLEWEFFGEKLENIKVYRRTKEKEYSIYQTLEGASLAFEDSGLKVGEEYGYRIKLTYADGSVSGFSKEILIEY